MSYQLTESSPYQYFWSKDGPRAQWMQVREDVVAERAERPAYFLRKEFVVSGSVKKATIKATAQGIYNIYIDGNRIGDKVLTPDTTDYRFHIAVQEYDVTNAISSQERTQL
jgi:alpha-L-rhamnosidase